MKAILKAIWNNPAVGLGFLGSVLVVATKLATGESISAEDVPALIAPLSVGVATHPLVTPVSKK